MTKTAKQICESKTRHTSELRARMAGYMSIHKRGDVDQLYPYQCKVCDGWHLTRQAGLYPAITTTKLIEIGASQ